MEHIKQQIEALREQADALAEMIGAKKAHVSMKLINSDNAQYFTEQEAQDIDRVFAESGLFANRSVRHHDYENSDLVTYHLKASFAVYIQLYVRRSKESEIDRLRRRIAELEGGEQA